MRRAKPAVQLNLQPVKKAKSASPHISSFHPIPEEIPKRGNFYLHIAELHSRAREHICISPIEVELTSSSRLNSLTAYLKKKTN